MEISCSLKRADGRLSVQTPVSNQPIRFQGRFQDAHGKPAVRLSMQMVA